MALLSSTHTRAQVFLSSPGQFQQSSIMQALCRHEASSKLVGVHDLHPQPVAEAGVPPEWLPLLFTGTHQQEQAFSDRASKHAKAHVIVFLMSKH
jgi:hypothetical protein